MTASLLSSPLHAALISDGEIAALLDDDARLRAMLHVEAALATVEGQVGLIPTDAARRIAGVAGSLKLSPSSLAARTAKDGMAVPGLVEALREAVAPADRNFVHFGGTSQDILDTAMVLSLREVLAILERRLAAIVKALGALADRHRRSVMPARTRYQPAVPTTFGAKAAGWSAPLVRDLDRLSELRPRVLVLSFFGPGGTLSALGPKGLDVEKALAAELKLGTTTAPWHTARDGIAELGGWLSLVAGSLGKIGEDVILLSQAEIGEVRPGTGGGSSTLPHKSNPVAAEVLVALAAYAADRVGSLHRSLVSAYERDGVAWTLEWLVLPDLLLATGAATRIAGELVAGLVVDTGRMLAHVTAPPGLLFAEAATYALLPHMARVEAEKVVKTAIERAVASSTHLIDVVPTLTTAPVDWKKVRDPLAATGAAEAYIDRVLASLPK
jgi:3-carboxy-cis,cis-muconate cycloisomerase